MMMMVMRVMMKRMRTGSRGRKKKQGNVSLWSVKREIRRGTCEECA
jgi:hypothetical protein